MTSGYAIPRITIIATRNRRATRACRPPIETRVAAEGLGVGPCCWGSGRSVTDCEVVMGSADSGNEGDDEVDEFVADERYDQTAEAVDEQVPVEQLHRGRGPVPHTADGQRDQRDDDQRVEDHRGQDRRGR